MQRYKIDGMLLATFLTTIFYSATYPYIHKEIISELPNIYIALNQVVNCISIIIFGRLWNESGYVKDADKIRAEYILGELNDALDTEYSMTGNQITNYQTMQTEIDKLIEKKKALAYVDAYAQDAVEYGKLMQQSIDEYAANKTAFDPYDRQMEEIRIKASQLTGEYIADEDELGDLLNNLGLTGNDLQNRGVDLNALKKFVDPYNSIIGNYKTTKENMLEAQANYEQALEYQNKLADAQRAISEERYNDVSRILWAEENAFKQIYEKEQANFDEREKAWNDFLKNRLAALDLSLKNGDRINAEHIAKEIRESADTGKAMGFTQGTEFTWNFSDLVEQMNAAGFDTSGLDEWGGKAGDSSAEHYINAFVAKMHVLNGINNAADFFADSFAGAFSLPMFASGGFLPSGQGIVAEAGPELIEIMNGGAKITPLTGNARNTAVSGADGNRSRVVYINNTINANVSGSYDVRRLAEDLAGEQRRVERNMGL